ncbi:MAG TPA: EAL domain-containing protein [Candidatus Cybelea sp.]|nr:EAL domain-containing protein [Candidatus Cybelea sp.]
MAFGLTWAEIGAIGFVLGAIIAAPVTTWWLVRWRQRNLGDRQELEQRARLPDENPNPVLRLDAAGNVAYGNAAARRMMALATGDPERAKAWRDLCNEMRNAGPCERMFEIGAFAFLLRTPGPAAGDGLAIYGNDISSLVAHERKLSDSESKLALATRTARLGLFEVEVAARTISYNDIYAWQVGLTPAANREPLEVWVDRVHPDDRHYVLLTVEDFMAGRAGSYRVEHRLSNGRGGWIWVSAIAEVMEIDPTGMPKRIMGSHLDITDLKASESALDRLNKRSSAQLDLVSLGDSGSEQRVLRRAAEHAAKLTESVSGVFHVLQADGSIEASYGFGPKIERGGLGVSWREGEIRESGRPVGRLEISGKQERYLPEDELTLHVIGMEAWRLVQRMRQSRKLEIQSRVLECAVNGMVITDTNGAVEWANPAFERTTGYALADLVGRDLAHLRAGEHDEGFYRRLWETLLQGRSFAGEFVILRKDGGRLTVNQTITPVVDDGGRIEKFVSITEDITERKSTEHRLHYLSQHDELTGLLNRANLTAEIEQAISETDRGGTGFAVLYVGLDHFKVVNDRLGRRAGDEVLRRVARVLGECVRPSDSVARCGGDEFAVLQRMSRDPSDAASLARRLSTALASASEEDALIDMRLSASVGITVFPADQGTADELVTNAELAMRRAKREARGSQCYFTPALHEAAVTRATLAIALPAAMREQQIFLMYQPIRDLKTGAVVGCEALARWQHPERGMIPPNQFIAIAEEIGLIHELGLYILNRAITDFSAVFPDPVAAGVTLSVNLSFGQFAEEDLLEGIRGELERTGFPARQLELELTESMLALEPERAIETTRMLSELGCKLAIDDFGTGYSSLAQLRRFRVDYLKIDRSFIIDLEGGEGPKAVVRAAISMAHSLGLAIIAEGVETPEQADFLRGEGAELVQGYLFGRPMPIEDFAKLQREPPSLPTAPRTERPRPVLATPRSTVH